MKDFLLSLIDFLSKDKSNFADTFQVFGVDGVLGLGHCGIFVICGKEVSILMLGLCWVYFVYLRLIYNVKICEGL